MNRCKNCNEKFDSCICPLVAKFFEENGHLMSSKKVGYRRDQLNKKKFFYIKGPGTFVSH
jgi:hypothetical protein